MSWTIVGYVAFVVILLVSVMLHEFGHFLTARRFGMKATEFFVGFGPRLWSFRRGETEYGVKAIPAGGYVRIVGMTELEEVAPQDEKRAFYRQPAPQRAIVLAAGSFVHFVIAILLFLFIPMALGVQEETDLQPPVVGGVAQCIPADGKPKCEAGDPTGPAQQVGIKPGDRIVSVNGARVENWGQLSDKINGSPPGSVEVVVDRGGSRLELAPVVVLRQTATDPDHPERKRPAGRIGIGPPEPPFSRLGPVAAVQEAGSSFWLAFEGTFKGLGAIPAAVPDLVEETFSDKARSTDGLVGPVGLGRVSGEVLGSEAPLSKRVAAFLFFMAAVNVFIGIFNLLPLLPLDGGHLAVLFFEKARQRVYRLVGRPDPGRVDLTRLLPAAYVFLVLVIGLSVLLLAADIVNPISING